MTKSYTTLLFIIAFSFLTFAECRANMTLISPPNDTSFAAANDLINVVFQWTKSSGATQNTQYMLEFDSVDNKFALDKQQVFWVNSPQRDTSFQPTSNNPLLTFPPRVYWWRVVAFTFPGGSPTNLQDSTATFQFTIAGAVKQAAMTFYKIPRAVQTIYGYGEQGPLLFSIGAFDSIGIVSVEAGVRIHGPEINIPTIYIPLPRATQPVQFPGAMYGDYWYPQQYLSPKDTVVYEFRGTDSAGAKIIFADSIVFRIITGAPDTNTDYARVLLPACQYVYELTDTAGRQDAATRKPALPNDSLRGLIHAYDSFDGPCASAAALQWLGAGRVDSAFIDTLAEACKTNAGGPGTSSANLANGAAALLKAQYAVALWQDTSLIPGFTALDSGVTLHAGPPAFADYSRALKDTEAVVLSIGWWQDSAGVRVKRVGGHFIAGTGFRSDGHFVAGAAVNDTTQFIEVMDPDCGRFRWIKWGGAGQNPGGMDTLYYAGVSAGMTPFVESMVTVKKITSSGVNEPAALPAHGALLLAAPNPFFTAARITVRAPFARAAYSLNVFDALGRQAADLTPQLRFVDGVAHAEFNAQNLPAGAYLCRFTAGGGVAVARLLLVK